MRGEGWKGISFSAKTRTFKKSATLSRKKLNYQRLFLLKWTWRDVRWPPGCPLCHCAIVPMWSRSKFGSHENFFTGRKVFSVYPLEAQVTERGAEEQKHLTNILLNFIANIRSTNTGHLHRVNFAKRPFCIAGERWDPNICDDKQAYNLECLARCSR